MSLVNQEGTVVPADYSAVAYWPDGSVKWSAVASVKPKSTQYLSISKNDKEVKKKSVK